MRHRARARKPVGHKACGALNISPCKLDGRERAVTRQCVGAMEADGRDLWSRRWGLSLFGDSEGGEMGAEPLSTGRLGVVIGRRVIAPSSPSAPQRPLRHADSSWPLLANFSCGSTAGQKASLHLAEISALLMTSCTGVVSLDALLCPRAAVSFQVRLSTFQVLLSNTLKTNRHSLFHKFGNSSPLGSSNPFRILHSFLCHKKESSLFGNLTCLSNSPSSRSMPTTTTSTHLPDPI